MGFVALGAVLGFAVLSSAMTTSGATRQTIAIGQAQPMARLVLWGPVLGFSDESLARVATVKFQVAPAYPGVSDVPLPKGGIAITYSDDRQAVSLSPQQWSLTWLAGEGDVLGRGETALFLVNLATLDSPLGPATPFTLTLMPPAGEALRVRASTPDPLTPVVEIR